MTREEYFKKRQEMIDEAQKLLDDEIGEEGTGEEKTEEAEKIANKIKALDEEYERNVKARANLKALQDDVKIDPTIFNLTNNKGKIEGIEDTTVKDEQEQYKNAWAKDMLGKQLNSEEQEIFNSINSAYRAEVQTSENNTILIPKTVASGIWKEIGDMYPLFGDASPTFVAGDLTIIAEEDGGDDAAWYDEETEVKEDGYKLKEITLRGCELAKDITVSWKLKKMSIDEFVPYITTLLAEKMGAALAKAIVDGKGKPGESDSFKPQPLGIKTALSKEVSKAQIIEYTDKIAYTDITKLMSVLKKWSNGACIYANSATIWTQLAEILDTTGKPIFIPDAANSDGVGRMFGRVVKMDDSMADGEILAGNISKGYAININENVTLYTDEHVKSRKTDYLTYSLVDGNVISNKAFGMIVKKTSAVAK
ncbi:phage major capsid protein [Clostridioides difficile]